MSAFTEADYALINLGVCIKAQADRLGIEHEGVPLEGVVVRIAARALAEQDEAVKAWGRALNAEAVISEALNHDPLHGSKEGLHCGGMAPCIRETLTAHEPWNYEK